MNKTTAFVTGGLGTQELLIVLGILMLLFGSTRLPKLARGIGQSLREFKQGVRDIEDEGDAGDERPRELKA